MKTREVLDLLKIRLQNITLSENESILISLLNIAVAELYRRFNLSVKSETVVTTTDLSLYELRNDNVQMIIGIYDKLGRELRQTDVVDTMEYDYKLLNYRSFLLQKPIDGYLYVVYTASPVKIKDDLDEIDIPDAMLDPMLTYISYLVNNTINRDNKNESTAFYQMFEKQCNDLINQGYKIPLHMETRAVQVKGYV